MQEAKLLEVNINLKNEVIKERKKSADMNDDIFNTNSRLIANLSEISALKEKHTRYVLQKEAELCQKKFGNSTTSRWIERDSAKVKKNSTWFEDQDKRIEKSTIERLHISV